MNPEDLREFTQKQPFVPFVIHLSDGRSFPVKHPDAILIGRRWVVVLNPDDNGSDFVHCTLRHITSVDLLESST